MLVKNMPFTISISQTKKPAQNHTADKGQALRTVPGTPWMLRSNLFSE